ncbi:hypothetical protein [Marinicellulosiphila megalodicopiae]|uniref:hypothetical protein n=1 Tax=Marinicellulosiphila megalodicopiae TaxID=2724896 RepID=UPI003BAEA17E
MTTHYSWTQSKSNTFILTVLFFCLNSFAFSSSLHCNLDYSNNIDETLTSQSYVIAQGTLITDATGIKKSIDLHDYRNFKLNLATTSILKGDINSGDIIEINYSTRPVQLRPCAESILQLDLNQVIVFLKEVIINNKKEYFFVASTFAISESSNQKATNLKKVINKQYNFLQNFDSNFKIKDETTHQVVLSLINNLQREDTQDRAFDELLKLDKSAVPSIIFAMDNYSQLSNSQFKLPTSSGYVKTYHPDLVVDALAIVLNTITGKHYGYIYNGATDTERAQTISAWKTYLINES